MMGNRREDLAGRLWPEKLQELQDALSSSLGIPILVVEPSGRPLAACEDLSIFCRCYTRRIAQHRPCLDCGREERAGDLVTGQPDPLASVPSIHLCPLGLADIAAPVYSAGEILGYVLTGQVVIQDDTRRERRPAEDRTDAEHEDYRALLARVPRQQATDMSRLAGALASIAWLLGALASARRRNLRLASRLREQSRLMQRHVVTDAVTGLMNHRRFTEALTAETRRVRRYSRQVSVVLFAIERLRTINDEFGHETGDAVLVAASQCLTSTLRQTDIIGRVSGDAFAAIMPETAAAQALVAVRRVHSAIDDLNASGDLPVEVRLAVGIVDRVGDPEDMLAAAAEAAARAEGADGATVYAPLRRRPPSAVMLP